ncbi:hypothetical protein ACFCWB_21755 [Streptomyces bacillaris]|uniref:hypothetical protein n=1 Tax=Streptomyces bacillaris TaxID=68179 RepID=UPI0035DB13DF
MSNAENEQPAAQPPAARAGKSGSITLPPYFAALLRAMHDAGDPRLPVTVARAHHKGWTHKLMGEAMGVTGGRSGQIAVRPHQDHEPPAPIPDLPPKPPAPHTASASSPADVTGDQTETGRLHAQAAKAVKRWMATQAARAEDAAFETARMVSIAPRPRVRDGAALTEWQERVESGDIQPEVCQLLLIGWKADPETFPGSVTLPWPMQCAHCELEKGIVLAEGIPKCPHPHDPRSNPPLLPGIRQEQLEARHYLKERRLSEEARAAGWTGEGPWAGKAPVKLTCPTCGRSRMARCERGEHKEPCAHRPSPQEQRDLDRFKATGWTVLEAPDPDSPTNKNRYRVVCPQCGFETHRVSKTRPCTHPHQENTIT